VVSTAFCNQKPDLRRRFFLTANRASLNRQLRASETVDPHETLPLRPGPGRRFPPTGCRRLHPSLLKSPACSPQAAPKVLPPPLAHVRMSVSEPLRMNRTARNVLDDGMAGPPLSSGPQVKLQPIRFPPETTCHRQACESAPCIPDLRTCSAWMVGVSICTHGAIRERP